VRAYHYTINPKGAHRAPGTGLDLSLGSVQTSIPACLKNLPPIFQISPTKVPCATKPTFFSIPELCAMLFAFIKIISEKYNEVLLLYKTFLHLTNNQNTQKNGNNTQIHTI